MNAESTVLRVLAWATPAGEHGRADTDPEPLPSGPLRGLGELGTPTEAVVGALAELTRRTAARLGAGSPPFGDDSPIGLGAVLMAAAVGGRSEAEPALRLADAVPPLRPDQGPAGWADALARHAVLAPVLAHRANGWPVEGEDPLMETLLRYSPLTTVLHRPPLVWLARQATAGAIGVARALQIRPRGSAVLVDALAAYAPDPAVLRWRTSLLLTSLQERPDLLADVYLHARLHHGAVWDEQVTAAGRAYGRPGKPNEQAKAVAGFWLPLARLRSRRDDLLRARTLMTGHEPVMTLVNGPHRAAIAAAASS